MTRRRALAWITSFAPFVGFLETLVGMTVIFRGLERQGPVSPDVLIDGVTVAFVTALVLLLFTVAPVAAWIHFRDRDDSH
jgi:biopolymer transport protein ExbB/TolQ